MAGPNIYDQIINGSFDAIGAKPAYLSPPTSVEEMYKGIYPPAAPQPTYQAGMTGRGLPASYGMDRLPQGTAGLPAPAGAQGISQQQWQAIGGWTVDPRTGQLAYAQPGQQTNPAVAAAAQQGQNVPLPRRRSPNAPTWMDMAAISAQQPVGANPGMGGAMIGNGQMASDIPPQGPPPAGIAPTVWAGQSSPQAGTLFGGTKADFTRGIQEMDRTGAVSPGMAYDAKNLAAQLFAQTNRANATGTAGGYQYQNGQKVGYAPINVGRGTYTPTNGAAAYALSNLSGQQAAQQRQATATGQTGVYNYVNGQRTGTVGGGTSAQAYERAAARSRDPGTSGEGGNPSWW